MNSKFGLYIMALLAFLAGCGGAVERGGLGEATPSGEKPDVSVVPTASPPVDGEPLPSPPGFKGCDSKSCEQEPPPALEATFCDLAMFGGTDSWGYQGCCAVKGAFSTTVTLMPGMLIKTDGGAQEWYKPSRVYYFASNGKRYVFPLVAHLVSWYGQLDSDGIPVMDPAVCNNVVEVPVALMASLEIGGNVVYRPGTFVTGIIPDPKRYAIARGHLLRKIADVIVGEPEGLPYSGTLQKRIRLEPDAFFVSYQIGLPVTPENPYVPAKELQVTLEQDLGLAP